MQSAGRHFVQRSRKPTFSENQGNEAPASLLGEEGKGKSYLMIKYNHSRNCPN